MIMVFCNMIITLSIPLHITKKQCFGSQYWCSILGDQVSRWQHLGQLGNLMVVPYLTPEGQLKGSNFQPLVGRFLSLVRCFKLLVALILTQQHGSHSLLFCTYFGHRLPSTTRAANYSRSDSQQATQTSKTASSMHSPGWNGQEWPKTTRGTRSC